MIKRIIRLRKKEGKEDRFNLMLTLRYEITGYGGSAEKGWDVEAIVEVKSNEEFADFLQFLNRHEAVGRAEEKKGV